MAVEPLGNAASTAVGPETPPPESVVPVKKKGSGPPVRLDAREPKPTLPAYVQAPAGRHETLPRPGQSGPPRYFDPEKVEVADVLSNPRVAAEVERRLLLAEGEYFRKWARDPDSGMTFDGVKLDLATGKVGEPRRWSAPSKESLDVALCLKAIEGNPQAVLLVGAGDPARARSVATRILELKMTTLEKWKAARPEFGGYLPWFVPSAKKGEITASKGEENIAPGLDNGEWVWSMLAAEQVLREKGPPELAQRFATYNDDLKKNAARIFWDPEKKKVRGDAGIAVSASGQPVYSTVPQGPGRQPTLGVDLNESTMMMMFVTLYGEGLTDADRDAAFADARYTPRQHKYGTAYFGWHAAPHESWATLFLPFERHEGLAAVYRNVEAIRTWESKDERLPGFPAAAIEPQGQKKDSKYNDTQGLRGLAGMQDVKTDMFAPYGAFGVLLQATRSGQREVALAWILNMAKQRDMITDAGLSEARRFVGDPQTTEYKTIDGSLTLDLAACGGLSDVIGRVIDRDGKGELFGRRLDGMYAPFVGEPFRRVPTFAPPPDEAERRD